jgi:hypothetical protein
MRGGGGNDLVRMAKLTAVHCSTQACHITTHCRTLQHTQHITLQHNTLHSTLHIAQHIAYISHCSIAQHIHHVHAPEAMQKLCRNCAPHVQ